MKTNDKSCLLDASQMVIGVLGHTVHLLSYLSHDGSERGFHTEEITDALEEACGIRVVKRELYPCLQVPGGRIIPVFTKEYAVQRFEHILERSVFGVLICRKPSGIHHAYALLNNKVFDTDGTEVALTDLDIVMLMEFI
jgi:hypothetical protein